MQKPLRMEPTTPNQHSTTTPRASGISAISSQRVNKTPGNFHRTHAHMHRMCPGSDLVFPSSSSAHSGARTQNQNPRPKSSSRVPDRHSKTVCVPPGPARPQKISPSTTDSHTAFRAPSPSGLAKGHHPSSVDERSGLLLRMVIPSMGSGLVTSLPRARPLPVPPSSVACMDQTSVDISKWPPPLMRSLLSSSHVIKRASLTVRPGIPIIIANQCSGVHHLCGVVTNPSIRILPRHAQDPITTSQVPPDESRYGGPGRSV